MTPGPYTFDEAFRRHFGAGGTGFDAGFASRWAEFQASLNGHERGPIIDTKLAETCEKLIQAGFRELAKKNHPDVGGDPRAMIAITKAREVLLKAIGK